jgi:hypothetical protein
MQSLNFTASSQRTYIGRGLDIVNELGAWRVVRKSHQFPKGSVDGNEQPVPLVEAKTP